MKVKLLRLLVPALIFIFTYANITHANDYYSELYNTRIQHSLYLKIPFHQDKFDQGKTPVKFGYSADFRRNSDMAGQFNISSTDIRASLVNIEFSTTSQSKIHLTGMPLAQFDRNGLNLGQSEDGITGGTNPTATKIVLGVMIAGGLFFATKSTTSSSPGNCTPSPVPGAPQC